MRIPDHCMFWAVCTLGYFGFLRAAEFTVPSLASFSPSIHFTVPDCGGYPVFPFLYAHQNQGI